MEVAVGDDVHPARLCQAQAGVHHLLVQKILLVDEAAAAGGGQPALQHLGLLTRPVDGQVRLTIAQERPGLREPLPPGQAGVIELIETAARQQLEVNDVVPVAEDPGGAQTGDLQHRGGGRVGPHQGGGLVGPHDLADPGGLHDDGAAAGAVDDESPGQLPGQGRQGRVTGVGQQVGGAPHGDVPGAQASLVIDALDARARRLRVPAGGPGPSQPGDGPQRAEHVGRLRRLCHLSPWCCARRVRHAQPASFSGDRAMRSMAARSALMRSRQDGWARRRGSASRASRDSAIAHPSSSSLGTGWCTA